MSALFKPNIDRAGRAWRFTWAVACIVGAAFTWESVRVLAVLLGIFGVLGLFEAWRGWCVVRACGIKTRF